MFKKDKKIKNGQSLPKVVGKKVKDKGIVFKAVFNKCRTDKWYFISLIITFATLGFLLTIKVKNAEGALIKKDSTPVVVVDKDTVTNDETTNKEDKTTTKDTNTNKNTKDDEIDLSEYIGYYSENVTMKEPFVLNETCTISEYKNVYHITDSNKVIKYYYNDCVGTIKLWEGTFSYTNDGGTRYISSNGYYFRFSKNDIKEIKDDETTSYKVDNELHNLKDNLVIKGVNLYFFGDSLIFLKSDDLIQLKKDEIVYQASKKYPNNGGDLEQRFYKSANKYQFKFMIFSNGEKANCYKDATAEDVDPLYKIYTVKYDIDSGLLTDEQIIERTKSDACENYESDLATLKE